MDDLISRQDAIDAVYKCSDIFAGDMPVMVVKADAYEALAQLPSAQPEQRWVLCSERLPEDIRPVIVTWKNTDPKSYYQYIVGKHFIGTGHFCNGKWFWYSSTCEDLLAEYGRSDVDEMDEAIEVIAWMPLPEPWEPDGKGQE